MSTNYGFFEAPQPEAAKGGPRKPTRQAPGRGVLDGIKKDLQVLASNRLGCCSCRSWRRNSATQYCCCCNRCFCRCYSCCCL